MNEQTETSAEQLTTQALNQFTGTETWYRNPLMPSITYTDGVKYLADTGEAHWLVTDILGCQVDPKVKKEEFQVWKLCVNKEKETAVLTCEDGNGNQVYTQNYGWTSFPLEEVTIWLTDSVMLLPSEY
jgi:hypothetical protein